MAGSCRLTVGKADRHRSDRPFCEERGGRGKRDGKKEDEKTTQASESETESLAEGGSERERERGIFSKLERG